MPRFDDIFTEVHAGNGVNVFEFDSRTAPSHPASMTWAEAIDIVGPIITMHIVNNETVLSQDRQVRIMDAWSTILRGV